MEEQRPEHELFNPIRSRRSYIKWPKTNKRVKHKRQVMQGYKDTEAGLDIRGNKPQVKHMSNDLRQKTNRGKHVAESCCYIEGMRENFTASFCCKAPFELHGKCNIV